MTRGPLDAADFPRPPRFGGDDATGDDVDADVDADVDTGVDEDEDEDGGGRCDGVLTGLLWCCSAARNSRSASSLLASMPNIVSRLSSINFLGGCTCDGDGEGGGGGGGGACNFGCCSK